MSHWSFVAAAYAIAVLATAGLLAWAFVSMRKAEAAVFRPGARLFLAPEPLEQVRNVSGGEVLRRVREDETEVCGPALIETQPDRTAPRRVMDCVFEQVFQNQNLR